MSWNFYIRYGIPRYLSSNREPEDEDIPLEEPYSIEEERFLHLANSETWGIKIFNVQSLEIIARDLKIATGKDLLENFFSHWRVQKNKAKSDPEDTLVERLKKNALEMIDCAAQIYPSEEVLKYQNQFRKYVTVRFTNKINPGISEDLKKIPVLTKLVEDHLLKEKEMIDQYFKIIRDRETTLDIMSVDILQDFLQRTKIFFGAEFFTTGADGKQPCDIKSVEEFCENLRNGLSRDLFLSQKFPDPSQCLIVEKMGFGYH